MLEKQILTRSGYQKFADELKYLEEVKRLENLEDIRVAKEQGDLSENAEYQAAREEQGRIEERIAELKAIIENCEIINDDNLTFDVVSLGTKVVLYDEDFDEKVDYYLVSESEADIDKNKLNVNSLLGKAIKDKKVGDRVEVNAPAGVFYYRILAIEKAS